MARIAQFIDTLDTGGAERVVVELSRHLPSLGHEVELMHFNNPWIVSECRKHGIRNTILPAEQWYRSKWRISGFIFRFAGLLRRRRFQLLHSHLYGPIAAGALSATAAGIPHVGTLHDTYLVEENPARFGLLRLAANMGSELVAVSESMRRYYAGLARGGVSFERIYNGVDIRDFKPGGLSEKGKYTFVSVGRLVAIKGYDILLAAMPHTPTSVRLRILGDGPERSRLEQQCHALGLRDRVEFLGFRSDVAGVLAEADAFVLASHSEGLSCSIVEAMAASLPCVVTDVGGNSELITEGEHGYRVPPGDAEALARRMSDLAADREKGRAFGAAGRVRAELAFSFAATLRGYDELYGSLLPLNSARRTA